MAYLRTNGRFSGRVSGRWGRASVKGRYQLGGLGGIEELGLGPQIAGDPVLALIAQLNRFAGKTVAPGYGCRPRQYLAAALPMVPTLDDKTATTAVLILNDRYSCVPIDLFNKSKADWANSGLTETTVFVTKNLAEIVITIAQYGDKVGLSPAQYGITERDPKFAPNLLTTKNIVIAGGVLVLGALVMRRK